MKDTKIMEEEDGDITVHGATSHLFEYIILLDTHALIDWSI